MTTHARRPTNTNTAGIASRIGVVLSAAFLLTQAQAQDTVEDVGPASVSDPLGDPATLKLIRNKERLGKAASEVRWEVEKNWNEEQGGSGGFGALELADDAVILHWKGEVPTGVLAAIERAKQIAPVHLEAVQYARAELKAAARKLGEFVESVSKEGYPYVGVYVTKDQTIRVEVREGANIATARSNLPSVDVPVEVAVGEPGKLRSRLNDDPPWKGGARWLSVRNGLTRVMCTLGFGVTDGYREYLLTAAHCATWPDNAHDWDMQYIGWAGEENWRHDIILIHGTDAGHRIYDGDVGTGEFTKAVSGWDWVWMNDLLCHSGSVRGVTCGIFPDGGWAESAWLCDSDGDCFWVRDLITAWWHWGSTAVCYNGDSGAPVFLPTSDGRVVAKGILTGCSGRRLYFQDFGTAWRDFGIWPLTGWR